MSKVARGMAGASRCISRVFNILGSASTAALFCLVLIASVLRIFGSGFSWSLQMSEYLFTALVFFMIPETVRLELNIRVDIFTNRLSPRRKRSLFVSTEFVSLAFCLLLTVYSWLSVIKTYKEGSVSTEASEIPMYIPELVIPIGLTFGCFYIGGAIIRRIREKG